MSILIRKYVILFLLFGPQYQRVKNLNIFSLSWITSVAGMCTLVFFYLNRWYENVFRLIVSRNRSWWRSISSILLTVFICIKLVLFLFRLFLFMDTILFTLVLFGRDFLIKIRILNHRIVRWNIIFILCSSMTFLFILWCLNDPLIAFWLNHLDFLEIAPLLIVWNRLKPLNRLVNSFQRMFLII